MRILDKMIAGLEYCQAIDGCSECPYRAEGCVEGMNADILRYLKDQQNFILWIDKKEELK